MKMAGIYENCRPFQKVAGHFWKCRKMADHYWKWPAIPESGWPFLKKAAHFRKWSRAISEIGKPFLKIAVHLWKWLFISEDGWSFFENDRPFLTTDGLFRNGQPFLKLEMAGHFWKCPAISEDEWLFLKMASHFWKLPAASGNGRPLWGISESGWPFLKMVGTLLEMVGRFWKWPYFCFSVESSEVSKEYQSAAVFPEVSTSNIARSSFTCKFLYSSCIKYSKNLQNLINV